MIQPREGEMIYEDLDELKFYYMFVSACLNEEQYITLKTEWNKQGGFENISWWKFVMNNTEIKLDIK